MPYSPPVGKELAVLKRLGPIYSRLKRNSSHPHDVDVYVADPRQDNWDLEWHWGTDYDFAIRGVRTNGSGHPHTLALPLLYLNRLERRMPKRRAEIIKTMDESEKIIKKMREICGGFMLCPDCKGTCGAYQIGVTNWSDCERCSGRGVLATIG